MNQLNKNNMNQLQSNELTFFQQLAVEGEVAAIMQGLQKDMDKLYFAFLKLALCEEKYLLVYKNEFIKYIDESKVNDLVGYRYSKIVPTYLFVYKFIQEIRSLIGESCGNLRIAKQPIAIVKSKFAVAMREFLTYIPATASAILDGIMREAGDEFSFISPIALALKENAQLDIMEQRVGYDTKIQLLSQPLDRVPLLSIKIEDERVQQAIRNEGMTKEERVQEAMNSLTGLISDIFNSMAPSNNDEDDEDVIHLDGENHHKGSERLVYLVKKIDKSNNKVVFTKEFDTQKQATDFIKDIVKQYPEIINRFNFSVELVES